MRKKIDSYFRHFLVRKIFSHNYTVYFYFKNRDPADELCWQHHLYSTLGNKKSIPGSEMKKEALELLISRIVAMGKVLYGLHIIDHPSVDVSKDAFPKVVSIQRKRAVIACFRQTSLHSLPRHVAVNLFLRTFRELWLEDENSGQEVLIDHLTVSISSSVLTLSAKIKVKTHHFISSKLSKMLK